VCLANIICKNEGKGIVLDRAPPKAGTSVYGLPGVRPAFGQEMHRILDSEIDKARELPKA